MQKTIGLLMNQCWWGYQEKLVSEVYREAKRREINLLIFTGYPINTPEPNLAARNSVYNLINAHNLDGIIISGLLGCYISQQQFSDFCRFFLPLPVVTTNIRVDGIPSIFLDNKAGMKSLISHFIADHGYRKIGFVRGPESNYEAQMRFEGYREALEEEGIEYDPELVCPGDFTRPTGEQAVRTLLDERKKDIQALVASNDDMMLGCMAELRERKISVPRQMAIGGFDNTSAAEFYDVPLTTVAQPVAEIAYDSIQFLLDIMDGKTPPEETFLSAKLVTRESCGCGYYEDRLTCEKPGNSGTSQEEILELLEKEKEQLLHKARNDFEAVEMSTVFDAIMDDLKKCGNKCSYFSTLTTLIEQEVINLDTIEQHLRTFNNLHTLVLSFAEPETVLYLKINRIFFHIRSILTELLGRKHTRIKMRHEDMIFEFRVLTENLLTYTTREKVYAFLTEELPRMGIHTFFISNYNDDPSREELAGLPLPFPLPKTSRMQVGCLDNRKLSEYEGREFYTLDLSPYKKHTSRESFSYIVYPLVSGSRQYGFMLFEYAHNNAMVYGTLQQQISAAFKSLDLFENINRTKLALEESNAKLTELDKLKTAFFANISHELRTPLTLIMGPLDLVMSGKYGTSVDRENPVFSSMLTNSRRLLNLINQLLDFSKIEAGRMKISPQPLSLPELIKLYIPIIQPPLQAKQLSLDYINHITGPGVVNIDEDLFEKAFFNLISNALKFTPEGGRITIKLSRQEEELVLALSDTGIGIEKSKLEMIFERFTQADQSASRDYDGTGIGLAFTKEIMKLHGGRITVESEPSKGSSFFLYFKESMEEKKEPGLSGSTDLPPDYFFLPGSKDPIRQKSAEENAEQNNEEKKDDLYLKSRKKKDGPPTVLIAEDSADMRSYYYSILHTSYELVFAANGTQALELLEKDIPDLIISDIMMPGMTGYELCSSIKTNKKFSQVPVILVTAKAGVHERIEGLEHGADDYLIKPFNPRELLVRIKNILRNRQLEVEVRKKNRIIEGDIKQASLIQKNILTGRNYYKNLDSYEVEVVYQPMNKRLSGDYYNIFFEKESRTLSMLIADATGHGVQAALSTMQIDILFKESLSLKLPDKRLTYINNKISTHYKNRNHFSALLLTIQDGILSCSGASHPDQMLIKKAARKIVKIQSNGIYIGFMAESPYSTEEFKVESGDILVLFSDGFFEYETKNKHWLDENIVAEILEEKMSEDLFDLSMETLSDYLLGTIKKFAHSQKVRDDITLICMRIK